MAELLTRDPENGRTVAMWLECGIQFRSNLIAPGGRIALHAHSYDHVALCTAGWFDCHVMSPDGARESFQVAAKDFRTQAPDFSPIGFKVRIPAGYQHTFELREARDVGEILCIWGEGTDK